MFQVNTNPNFSECIHSTNILLSDTVVSPIPQKDGANKAVIQVFSNNAISGTPLTVPVAIISEHESATFINDPDKSTGIWLFDKQTYTINSSANLATAKIISAAAGSTVHITVQYYK